jgi:hypothetical protein
MAVVDAKCSSKIILPRWLGQYAMNFGKKLSQSLLGVSA